MGRPAIYFMLADTDCSIGGQWRETFLWSALKDLNNAEGLYPPDCKSLMQFRDNYPDLLQDEVRGGDQLDTLQPLE
jgi:hypothetical protein